MFYDPVKLAVSVLRMIVIPFLPHLIALFRYPGLIAQL
jgi:hypothetical protein